MAPKGPYKLVTVNKVPARAKILIGRVVEDVKDSYTIEYVKNAEREFDPKSLLFLPCRFLRALELEVGMWHRGEIGEHMELTKDDMELWNYGTILEETFVGQVKSHWYHVCKFHE